MADILDSFQAVGSFPVHTDVLKIITSALVSVSPFSLRIRGCMPSGPGDFETLSLQIFFKISSSGLVHAYIQVC